MPAYKPVNGDDLHNYNCYRYLMNLKAAMGDKTAPEQRMTLDMRKNLEKLPETYDPKYAYGDFYSKLQKDLDTFFKSPRTLDPAFERLVLALYDNDNEALESAQRVIQTTLRTTQDPNGDKVSQTSSILADAITKRLNQRANTSGNEHTPQKSGSQISRGWSTIASTFKPQHGTSLPTNRHYAYTDADPTQPKEIRMGTQGQYTSWTPRVAPMFCKWVELRHRQNPDKPYTHVYFNNLGRDRSGLEGDREKKLTGVLEDMNRQPGIAVITLPADQGIFDSKTILSSSRAVNKRDFSDTMLKNLRGLGDDEVIDVHIPFAVKDKIYSHSGIDEEADLKVLIKKSYAAMGLDDLPDSAVLSHEQMQAVYFHLVKFELTNLILTKLQPDTWNVSCKDGIDRAASASLYYNLIKSFESSHPMSESEFERGMHAAATAVKGRGMNHHRDRVWSVANQYVQANKDALTGDKAWLVAWVAHNKPESKAAEDTKANRGHSTERGSQANITQRYRRLSAQLRGQTTKPQASEDERVESGYKSF